MAQTEEISAVKEISKGNLNGTPVTRITDIKTQPMYFFTRMENGSCTDYRMLNLKGLLNELEMGTNQMGLSSAEISEVKRLGRLATKVLNS